MAILFCLAVGGASLAGDAASGGHDMSGMDTGTGEWTGNEDGAFLYGMIEHHKGAVDMALAVVKTSKDPDVAGWAKSVIEDQEKEITLMRNLISQHGFTDVHGAADAMAEHMKAMLEEPVSSDPDVNFVAQMVPHHAGAIDMALPALVESDIKQIRILARDIIAAQAKEIYMFREWLEKKGIGEE